jgi:hypothetical protein
VAQPTPANSAARPRALNADHESERSQADSVGPEFPKHLLLLAAGIRAGLAASDALLAGPWLGAHWSLSRFELGLVAGTTLPAELQRDAVRIAVRRHSLAVEVRVRMEVANNWELALGLEAGIAAYARETRSSIQASLATTPDATAWSAALGPLAELRWRFVRGVGLALRLGIGVNPQPTRFVYRQAGERLEVAKLAVFEPWAGVGLFVDIWK